MIKSFCAVAYLVVVCVISHFIDPHHMVYFASLIMLGSLIFGWFQQLHQLITGKRKVQIVPFVLMFLGIFFFALAFIDIPRVFLWVDCAIVFLGCWLWIIRYEYRPESKCAG